MTIIVEIILKNYSKPLLSVHAISNNPKKKRCDELIRYRWYNSISFFPRRNISSQWRPHSIIIILLQHLCIQYVKNGCNKRIQNNFVFFCTSIFTHYSHSHPIFLFLCIRRSIFLASSYFIRLQLIPCLV